MSNDKPTGQTYEIRTISEFMALTPRQREHAAKDLLLWVRYVNMAEMMGELTDGAVTMTASTDVFQWIDDGEHIANANYSTPDGKFSATFKHDHGDEFRGSEE